MSANMNKNELIDVVAEKAGLTKADSKRAIEATVSAIIETLAKGKDSRVALAGFGTYVAKERAARDGRNPQTGETIKIAATVVPTFRPGKEFKEAVKK